MSVCVPPAPGDRCVCPKKPPTCLLAREAVTRGAVSTLMGSWRVFSLSNFTFNFREIQWEKL